MGLTLPDIPERIEKLERLKNRKYQKRKKVESYKKLTKGEPIIRFKTILISLLLTTMIYGAIYYDTIIEFITNLFG
tara:strand:- start:1754 stop:1981 length:228 start_codon:yes stop_codon:yes gene_type:complete